MTHNIKICIFLYNYMGLMILLIWTTHLLLNKKLTKKKKFKCSNRKYQLWYNQKYIFSHKNNSSTDCWDLNYIISIHHLQDLIFQKWSLKETKWPITIKARSCSWKKRSQLKWNCLILQTYKWFWNRSFLTKVRQVKWKNIEFIAVQKYLTAEEKKV